MIESSELGEIWVVVNVNGHRIIEDYYISSYGRLCSMKYGKQKIVNGSLNRKGYVMDKYFTRDENGNVEKAFELKIEGKKNPEISKITGISLDSLQKMFHGLSWRRIYDKYKDKLNK